MRLSVPTALTIAMFTSATTAQTDMLRDHVYRVASGVDFMIANDSALDFLYSWSDSSGDVVDVADPTIFIAAGQTYTFSRTTESHRLVITNDTLEITGTDGSYERVTTERNVLRAATLQPEPDFTAFPPPSPDPIEWTPGLDDVGTYAYTCHILSHVGMTGRLYVYNPCTPDLTNDGSVNTNDFFAYLALYQSQDVFADFTGDGLINTNDFFAFLAAYQAAC